MAAGIGSRFGGGIKQLEPVGPSGEIIMDYSIHDALEAGFNKVVFIIRKDLEKDFREIIGNRMEKLVETAYAFQEIDDLPVGFTKPADRTKPKVHDYLVEEHPASDKLDFCMAGFLLENTLSENGGVTRGICSVNEQGHLTKVTETKNIVKTAEGAAVQAEDGSLTAVQAHCPVSMNMWGFTPEIFGILEKGFAEFLGALKDQTKGEYLIPTVVDQLIQTGVCNVTVLESRDKWFGVTYKEDKPLVVRSFRELIDAGVYKERLFD